MKIILMLFISFLFSEDEGIRELNKKNFGVATRSGVVIVEYYASWNIANKIAFLDSVEIQDAKVFRVNIDTNPEITAKQTIVVVPTIVIYDDGIEFKRKQADLTFKLKIEKKDLQVIVDEILMSKF